ncbi:MAG TPA: hypothetical protein VFD70_06615 [Anaerolineae bacterium]|nr:hypothetical protein [Anaerolineae bacterium]
MKVRSTSGTDALNANPLAGPMEWLRKHRGSALVYFVLLPLMACLVLMLPPISLGSLIANVGYISVNKAGKTISDTNGAEFTIPENAVRNGTSVKLTFMSLQAFQVTDLARTLPAYLQPISGLYRLEVQGEAPKEMELVLPLPIDAEPYETLDLFALFNQQWFKIPFTLNVQDEQIHSALNFAPEAVIVVQTQPRAPVISADLQDGKGLPDAADNILVEVNPVGLQLAGDGSIAGEPVNPQEAGPASNFAVVPTITNVDVNGPRIDLTGNMMEDEAQRTAHINALVDLAVQRVYRGYNLDYQGISTSDEPLFTMFVKELARALHAKQKTLSVILPAPTPISEDNFDTAGYNWALIGRYADEVKIPLLSDPRAFEGTPTLQEQYLSWAVGQVDRSKLELIAPTEGRDSTADAFTPVAFGEALKLVGAVSVPENAQPGTNVTLRMDGLAKVGGIEVHQPSGLFYFNYKDANGTAHTVWLENADSLSKKVALALKYNLGGIALANYQQKSGLDDRVWTVLENYKSMQPTIVDDQLKLVWSIDGKQIGTSSVRDPKIVWQAPKEGGKHEVSVALSVDGGLTAGPPVGSVVQLAELGPTPKATEEATPTKAAPKATAKPASQNPAPPKPTAKPASNPAPASVGVNRFGYGIQVRGDNPEAEMSAINNLGFNWVKIQVRWCDIESAGKGVANLGGLDNFVNTANAHGIKVLLSVVCAPSWSRADGGAGGSGPPDDMNHAADFMSGLASAYCGKGVGAIEVWNEENLLTEWHGHQLSAAAYIDMLSKTYPRIKQACPDIVVVSGALTPTGFNDGVTAFDDGTFLEQLYQAGLRNFSDAIGAHPSGFNVPALCNVLDPGCNRPEASFQAPFQSRHHSWGFLGTMTTYRNIMAKYGDGGKQIWATEFGWPVGTGGSCGGGPCHPAGADNSPDNLAQWFPQAFQWAKQQGWVGVMFVWNLDFHGGEVGAFHIDDQPAFGALAAMPK